MNIDIDTDRLTAFSRKYDVRDRGAQTLTVLEGRGDTWVRTGLLPRQTQSLGVDFRDGEGPPPPENEDLHWDWWTSVLSVENRELRATDSVAQYYLMRADRMGRVGTWAVTSGEVENVKSILPLQLSGGYGLYARPDLFWGRNREKMYSLDSEPVKLLNGQQISLCLDSDQKAFFLTMRSVSDAASKSRHWEWTTIGARELMQGEDTETRHLKAEDSLPAPVCLGSLDGEPGDEAIQLRTREDGKMFVLEGLAFDFSGEEPPRSLFTLEMDSVWARDSPAIRWDNFGDLNDDGITDLLVVQEVEDNQLVHIFLGPHSGKLTLGSADIVVDTAREGVREELDVVRTAVGDVTGDGASDLVVAVPATEGGDEIWIFNHEDLF